MAIKTGVLLVNTGSPDSTKLSDIKRYLREFLSDYRVLNMPGILRWALVNLIIAPTRGKKSQARYKRIWTEQGSPLILSTSALQQRLDEVLGDDYFIEFAMRYGSPSIASRMKVLEAKEVNRLIVVPLFPQYASASTGSIVEEVVDSIRNWWVFPEIVIKNEFHARDSFIRAWVSKGKPFWEKPPNHVLFSFHGIPESHIQKGDLSQKVCLQEAGCCQNHPERNCYRAQCFQTAYLIAQGLSIPKNHYSISFQSRLGRAKWISPYTREAIIRLAETGVKKLLVFCPSFVTDCLETLDEIQFEEAERFRESGGDELILVPSLNTDSLWVECLREMISE